LSILDTYLYVFPSPRLPSSSVAIVAATTGGNLVATTSPSPTAMGARRCKIPVRAPGPLALCDPSSCCCFTKLDHSRPLASVRQPSACFLNGQLALASILPHTCIQSMLSPCLCSPSLALIGELRCNILSCSLHRLSQRLYRPRQRHSRSKRTFCSTRSIAPQKTGVV
jgi:hypothetical protein